MEWNEWSSWGGKREVQAEGSIANGSEHLIPNLGMDMLWFLSFLSLGGAFRLQVDEKCGGSYDV